MKKRTKTIPELFASPAFDEAVKRAVSQAIEENRVLDRLREARKSRKSKARASRGRSAA